MGATPGESSCRKLSKSLVRQGEVEKGKSALKNNVSRDDNVIDGEIKTPVAFVISGVSEENTSGGPGCQFMSDFDGEIEIAGATEHTQLLMGGGDSVEGDVWTSHADRLGREVIQQICGGVETFYPIASQNRSLKEQE
jgi:hypothetical protein